MRCDTFISYEFFIMNVASICMFLLILAVAGIWSNEDDGDTPWTPYCPMVCSCGRKATAFTSAGLLRVTDCSNANLRSLPLNMSVDTEAALLGRNRLSPPLLMYLETLPNLTALDLNNNHIYTLESSSLTLSSLKFLCFDSNEIDYLPNRTFLGFPNLQSLALTNNKIEIVHPDAFRGLRWLQHLDLSTNRIYEVNPAWFRHLFSLQYLDLHNNNIHTLRNGDFAPLSRLSYLDLSSNHLRHVHDHCFLGIEILSELHMHNNHLHAPPLSALQDFILLDVLDLSNNHFDRLAPNSIDSINATRLQLNQMTNLNLIDQFAFSNLLHLVHLELSDNRALLYIDREAFVNIPLLRSVHLHNNNLSAIEQEMIFNLPSLESLTLHENPLFCDCSLSWLQQEFAYHSHNYSFGEGLIKCTLPAMFHDKLLTIDSIGELPDSCAPRILPLFQTVYNTVLGDQVQLDCRAIGIPWPQIDWLLPSHTKGVGLNDDVTLLKSGTLADSTGRIVVTTTGTLYIDYIQGNDHGQYTCLASNPIGRDELSMRLHVKNMLANVLIISITSNSITLTWKSTRYTHDYQILYRKSNTNQSYHVIDIKPYMRSYTASELDKRTMYEFCIAIKHKDKSMFINCTLVSTRDGAYEGIGVFNIRNYIIGGSLVCLIGLVLVVCLATYALKKYNKRRRQQEELYGDNLSQLFLASMDSMSDTTPITYENRGAEIFDDDDIEEIRVAAERASATTVVK